MSTNNGVVNEFGWKYILLLLGAFRDFSKILDNFIVYVCIVRTR